MPAYTNPSTPAIDYCSTGDVGIYLEQLTTSTSTTISAALGAMITRVSRQIDGYVGRRFYTSTGDETRYFDGPRWNRDPYVPAPGLSYWFGSQRFMPNIDIVSITTLELANGTNNANNGSTGIFTLIDSRDYSLEPMDRRDGFPALWLEMSDSPVGTYTSNAFQWFSPGKNTIKITGKFGWGSTSSTGIPDDIRECAIEMVVRMWKSRDVGFADVVGVDALGTATISKAMPYSVKSTLDQYRRIGVV